MTVDTGMATPAHDYIPGTVHLVDLQGTIHARHAEGGKHDIVLVPAPSANPDDPLNWTPRRKLLSLFCLTMYASIRCLCTLPDAVADSIFQLHPCRRLRFRRYLFGPGAHLGSDRP